ncbi:acyl carrier protein [Streptomyces sp. NPDC050658]|uniref:acyl carrier protein n=1 Tax=unclassified Streptomyces TaxID=2593676 RepID=UPI003443C2C4
MQYAEQIKEFLAAELPAGASTAELDPDLDLLEHGVLDSLGVLQLIDWICDRYGVRRDGVEVELEDIQSIRAIDSFIQSQVRAGNDADAVGAR